MSDLVERLREIPRGQGHSFNAVGPNGEGCRRVVPYGNMMNDAADRIIVLENALAEMARRGALCIHQNIGRWDMSIEHDKRSYNIIDSNNRIALDALKDK